MSKHSSRPRHDQPRMESLEDRTLPSVCHVTRLTDQAIGKGYRGDLRYCINKANFEPGPDAITFAVTGTVNVQSPLPELNTDMSFWGPGAELMTIRRWVDNDFRIFKVADDALVQMSGLTIANGSVVGNEFAPSADGGGIYNDGRLTLSHCVLTGNSVSGLGAIPARGGGIYNAGSLTVRYSTLSGNGAKTFQAPDSPATGGGIHNDGTLLITNSALTANHAGAYADVAFGGGIYNQNVATIRNTTIALNGVGSANGKSAGAGVYQAGGSLGISNSTISGNFAAASDNNEGGGIAAAVDIMMWNTILAGNSAATSPDFAGNLIASGYNLIGNTSGGSGYSMTDLLNVDPNLGNLADNGGLTETMALMPGSPAIDAGDNTDAPGWDQRGPGYPRIVNGTIDIGAFEVQPSAAARMTCSRFMLRSLYGEQERYGVLRPISLNNVMEHHA